MLFKAIVCPSCQSTDIVKHGPSGEGKERYRCRNTECKRCTFILNYTYNPHSVHKKRTKKIRKVIMTKDNTDK
jgi:transposase-like protein